MSTALKLPHWDVTVIYPGLDSSEFAEAFHSVGTQISELAAAFDRAGVGGTEAQGGATADTVRTFEEIARAFNDVVERTYTIGAYIRSFTSTDSFDDVAQARLSELQQHMVRLSQLSTRFTAWIGVLDVEGLIQQSDLARQAAFPLRKEKLAAAHLMSPAEEELAAELNLSGGSAWGKLHSTMTSQMMVPIEIAGRREDVPMTVVRNMAHDNDRDTRKRAYEAELDAWKRVARPLAAALNSIKGESNTLELRRGWGSPLDVALHNNNIDRQTLDAMMEAARASFPDFRRYLHAKARALGIERLAWFDLFAPVGESTSVWDYDTAHSFLLEQFGTYSPRLRDFVDRAFRENWIDAEPRPGKVGGAFCMWLRADESRVLTNYMPTYDGVSTLAHELGHAYHNYNLAGRMMIQRQTPMTLAETASIFCETITEHAALARAGREEQIAILEASVQGACQIVVDISSRFLFEQGVFDRRRKRELSVDELNELMLETQRATYGDGLDQNALHPYMWAVKSHYYSSGRPFYNFPYMFGMLFGLGLYSRFTEDPDAFRTGYDRLLSSTGLADAATLAAEFDIDIRTPAFWHSSLDIVRGNIDRFEALIAQA